MTTTKTDIADVIRNRRTIHNFKPDPVPPAEEIQKALQMAICAPNHHATEPWRFYLIGNETKEKICQLNAEMIEAVRGEQAAQIKLQRWREIPGWLILTCTNSTNEIRAMEDYAACCCAAQNMMLYLWSIDIGVKWTTGGVTRDPRFYEILGIDPDKESVVGLFWYGYPDDVPQGSRKQPADKLINLP